MLGVERLRVCLGEGLGDRVVPQVATVGHRGCRSRCRRTTRTCLTGLVVPEPGQCLVHAGSSAARGTAPNCPSVVITHLGRGVVDTGPQR